MADAFISYVAEDSAVAAEVARALADGGYSSWRYEADAVGGQNYLLQTRDQIESCGVFVVVLSKPSLGSEQVDREIVRAHECAKPFLPILSRISYDDYTRRRPAWQQAIGAVTALSVPEGGVPEIAPRIVAAVQGLLRRSGDAAAPAPQTTWALRFRRRLRSRRTWRTAAVVLVVGLAVAFGANAWRERQAAADRHAAAEAAAEGARLVDAGRLDEARAPLERALALDPGQSTAHLHLGRLFHARREPEKALEHLERRLAAHPGDAQALLHRGLVRSRLGQAQGAREDLEAALTSRTLSEDDWVTARLERGLLLLDQHALTHPVRIELSPEARRDVALAESDFSAVYDARGWVFALVDRGRARSWLRRDEEAQRDLDEAYRRATRSGSPDDASLAADAAYLIGLVELRRAAEGGGAVEVSRANESFDVALRHGGPDPRYRVMRAVARAGLGKIDEALGDLRAVAGSLGGGDPIAPLVRTLTEEVEARLAGIPVRDLVVTAGREESGEGPGVAFRVACTVHGRRGLPCRLVVRLYEGPDTPYFYRWRPLRAFDPRHRAPDGSLALEATVVPESDPYRVADLRLFLPYAATPLYDGPQRYEFTLRFEDPQEKPISQLVDGSFSFTKERR